MQREQLRVATIRRLNAIIRKHGLEPEKILVSFDEDALSKSVSVCIEPRGHECIQMKSFSTGYMKSVDRVMAQTDAVLMRLPMDYGEAVSSSGV